MGWRQKVLAGLLGLVAVAATATSPVAGAEGGLASETGLGAGSSHAIAMHGDPKLDDGFKHFSYVNPKAPKGGRIVLGIQGTFDSLNPLIIKGVPAAGLRNFIYESLLTRGRDEPFTLYPGLAERIQVAADRSAITFHIDDEARFSDGEKVDAEDILFSWRVLRDHGRPNHRSYYAKVTKAVRVSDSAIRFELGAGQDLELPLILGLMPILPSHLLDEESFQKTTLVAPVGSGPYVISQVDAGRSLTYARNPDWWGANKPQNVGRFNFDEVRYDYFRDGSALFEAFKSGRLDLRPEEQPSEWAEGYDVAAVRDGRILKREFEIGLPAGMTGIAINTRRGPLADRRVREALIRLFDFEWVNANLFHGLYTRTQSFFARSALSSHGRPADEVERALLAPFSELVLPAVMAGTYAMPVSRGDGRNRENWRDAVQLLRKAGYELKDRVMTHRETGRALSIELLAASYPQKRLFLAYANDLRRVGIQAEVRLVDSAQFQSRLKSYDYDLVQTRWPSSLSPGNEQVFRWSSQMADREGTFNFAGVKNAGVDAVIQAMLKARSREEFVSSVRALDRLLLSGHYVIPLFHLDKQWIAHWAYLKAPQKTPLFGYQFDTWWMDPAHAKSQPGQQASR